MSPRRVLDYDRQLQVSRTSDGSITDDALDGVMEYQEYLCAICGEIPRGLPSFDHIIPLARGGTHTIANIQMTCWPCNNRKRIKPPQNLSDNRTILEDRYFSHPLETVFAISSYSLCCGDDHFSTEY